MDLFDKCHQPILALDMKKAGFDAFYRVLQSAPDAEVVVEGRRMIMLGSNNYLGLANDPRVKRAAAEAVERWGTGTAGARCQNGTLELHADLERRLARFFRRDAAVFFTSGYMANLGVISALAQRGDHVVVDRNAHASILDGAKLSHAELKRFKNNDVKDLERVLASCGDAGKLVAVDGVYSMDGDLAPLPDLLEVCRRHGARLLVDDAHGLGVFGAGGRGVAEHFGVERDVDVLVGTLSKATGGVGGYVVAEAAVLEFIRHVSRPLIFTASLPAPIVAATIAALDLVDEEPERRAALWRNTERLVGGLRARGLDVADTRSPIVPVRTGDMARTFGMWSLLKEEGVYVNPVLPPAVPPGKCILRLTVMATHTSADVDRAVEAIAGASRAVDAPGA